MIIETERLTMRPLTIEDAPDVQRLLNDPTVAAQLPAVPYPLPEGGAEEWIRSATEDATFACVERAENAFGGIVALHLEPGNRAQLGGWCGEPWRHNGYAVEAMHAAVRYGYEVLGLTTIYALRKGRLWIAPRDFADRRLPFRHSPDEWHILEQAGEESSRLPAPMAAIGRKTARLRRLFVRS